MHYTKEIMSPEFTKYHIAGLPFNAAFHHFTGADIGEPHDHPYSFQSHILKGGYIEKIYNIKEDNTWGTEIVTRKEGTSHSVEASVIHELIELPEGECWTLVIPGPVERECRFWQFSDEGIKFRAWWEREFMEYR